MEGRFSSHFAIARSLPGADLEGVLNLVIVMELQADGFGPHELHTERIVLPADFANSAFEAHAKLVEMIATEEYFELPRENGAGMIPGNSDTVRSVCIWER